MGDRDHRLGAFGDGFPFEVDDSVLGYDEHDVAAGSSDDVAGHQVQHDAAGPGAGAFVRRRHADERLAAVRGIAGANKLELTSGAAYVAVPARLACGLALELHLRRVVE